jgi:membrane associated rhomboid family serine protease
MIPIRDTNQSKTYPVVNIVLIAANVFFYLVETAQGPLQDQFVYIYGLVPARYSVPEIASYFSLWQQVVSFFSFMFLHGGFLHLLGNMWSLYIFGDNVEDRLGPARYLIFYLLSGWASGLSHLLTNLYSEIPTIGASGAIAGVMGAYLVLFPSSRILTLIPIIFIPYFIEVPAFLFLGLWFILQFISAAGSGGQAAGVAWWAHIGGFLFGIILLKLFMKAPAMGVSQKLKAAIPKTKSPHLQVIHANSSLDSQNVYAQISLTPREAQFGTRKLVNVPWGFQSRIFRVSVPPGVHEGTTLRLAGMGKRISKSERGDLFLTILIKAQG